MDNYYIGLNFGTDNISMAYKKNDNNNVEIISNRSFLFKSIILEDEYNEIIHIANKADLKSTFKSNSNSILIKYIRRLYNKDYNKDFINYIKFDNLNDDIINLIYLLNDNIIDETKLDQYIKLLINYIFEYVKNDHNDILNKINKIYLTLSIQNTYSLDIKNKLKDIIDKTFKLKLKSKSNLEINTIDENIANMYGMYKKEFNKWLIIDIGAGYTKICIADLNTLNILSSVTDCIGKINIDMLLFN